MSQKDNKKPERGAEKAVSFPTVIAAAVAAIVGNAVGSAVRNAISSAPTSPSSVTVAGVLPDYASGISLLGGDGERRRRMEQAWENILPEDREVIRWAISQMKQEDVSALSFEDNAALQQILREWGKLLPGGREAIAWGLSQIPEEGLKGDPSSKGGEGAMQTPPTWSGLLPKGRGAIAWGLSQMEREEELGRLQSLDGKMLELIIASSPEMFGSSGPATDMKTLRELYDLAMQAEAERKSGRDFSTTDSPPMPLKWGTLTKFQQDAVEHARVSRETPGTPPVEEGQRIRLCEDMIKEPQDLQRYTNEYRQYRDGQRRGLYRYIPSSVSGLSR